MTERHSRSEILISHEAIERLAACRVAVFGLGGVGGMAAEALVRSGVGALDLFDGDRVCESNLNRQIIALIGTVGELKAEVAARRARKIDPGCRVTAHPLFLSAENADSIDFSAFDYIVDAVDDVKAKLIIAERGTKCGTPVISSCGAGGKLDPSRAKVADISRTSVCPLARVMRHELKKRGISRLKTVFSDEPPIRAAAENGGRPTVGSMMFVPAAFGLLIAAEVVKDLISAAGRKSE